MILKWDNITVNICQMHMPGCNEMMQSIGSDVLGDVANKHSWEYLFCSDEANEAVANQKTQQLLPT